MGENNSKWNNWQTINLKNIQATSAAQFQKNKRPNQKMGQRTKQTFLQRRHTMANIRKDAQHHSLSEKCKPKPQWGTISCRSESVQFSSVAQSCLTLCDPMDGSAPGFPVHHQLPELTQTHAHWVGDAIQPSHPLSSPSPPAFDLSQHQGLFQWVSSLNPVAKAVELQHQSFQWIFKVDFL